MRFVFLFLAIASLSFSQNITYFLNLSGEIECPGDILTIKATASNGDLVSDVELRLVLYEPYQGLRAVKNTDSKGEATTHITKPGLYRIYIDSGERYNHPKYVVFSYPELCPPPPPKEFDLIVGYGCESSQITINITENGNPVKGVFVHTDKWSSTTSQKGTVVFPLEEGELTVQAELFGYLSKNLTTVIDCSPPECLADADCASNQYCSNETCLNITGECGYPENHSWINYECCEDDDCGYKMLCENNSCTLEPEPPKPEINETAEINETTEEEHVEEPEPCITLLIPFILIISRIIS